MVDLPPPSVVFEDLDEERGVVAFPNEDFVELKETALEVELDLVAVVHSLEQFAQYHFFAMNDEVLAFKCV